MACGGQQALGTNTHICAAHSGACGAAVQDALQVVSDGAAGGLGQSASTQVDGTGSLHKERRQVPGQVLVQSIYPTTQVSGILHSYPAACNHQLHHYQEGGRHSGWGTYGLCQICAAGAGGVSLGAFTATGTKGCHDLLAVLYTASVSGHAKSKKPGTVTPETVGGRDLLTEARGGLCEEPRSVAGTPH